KYPDGFVQIAHQKMQWYFNVEVKARVTHATLGMKQLDLFRRAEKTLLVTEYVTPAIADQLKELNIFFIDTAGNAFINEQPLYVFIKGNKPLFTLKVEPQKRLFKPSGLKVVFVLLNNPDMVNKPYRDIAKAAGVALGTIGWLIRDLKEMGFCIGLSKHNRKMMNLENLIKRWAEAYPEQLRPKLIRGRFETTNNNWWKEINIKMYGALWGGEVAAATLTNYLKPVKATIYTNEAFGKLVLKNRLRKAEKGDVEIITRFWNFKYDQEKQDVVPPLLVYADLMATADPRNIEVAGNIYEKYLDRLIREN
ncbi:MAG: type IV toxin-antitoxin system AbiEi family antitoxin, partial [Desulfobacteraceae bacterium]|nr:type IV toxin-antitoxin system AbiEi family antitoxin [Desulfobacteraceae bacterium]